MQVIGIWVFSIHIMALPSPSNIHMLSTAEQNELLDNLFEKHPDIHKYLIPVLFNGQKFDSYSQLIELAREKLQLLDPHSEVTKGIIAAHPRLGVPAALSAHSSKEQSSIFADGEVSDVVKRFIKLNETYENQFPGLRYILFVNGRSRDEIFADFERRIKRNNFEAEVKYALSAMCDIALDRVKKAQIKL